MNEQLNTKSHISTGRISILKLLGIGNLSIHTSHRSKFTPPKFWKPMTNWYLLAESFFSPAFKKRAVLFSHIMLPPSKIKATSSRRPKSTHISMKKGSDNCLACNIALENDSYAILCDGCDKWICTKCLDMPESEYMLITKISQCIDICIKCPACKYRSTSVNTQNPSVENIVQATIISMKNEIIDKIPSQAAFQEIVQAS